MKLGAEVLRPIGAPFANPVAEFDERHRFTSSLDAMRQDPVYQLFTSRGMAGATALLNYLSTTNRPTWLVMAVDEIAGRDVTGLHDLDAVNKGLRLEEMQKKALVWGENFSLIPIQNRGERARIGAEAMTALKETFFEDPAVQRAMTEALFFRDGAATTRSVTADLLLDGSPASFQYSKIRKAQPYGNITTEDFVVQGIESTDTPLLLQVVTISEAPLQPYSGVFRANGSGYATREAAKGISDFISTDHQIEVQSATARIA